MKVDLLLVGLHVCDEMTDPDQFSHTARVLHQRADTFLRGGGTVTLTEWSTLSLETKDALAQAGDRIRSELASLIGTACSGPYGPAIALGDVEASDVVVRGALRVAVGA